MLICTHLLRTNSHSIISFACISYRYIFFFGWANTNDSIDCSKLFAFNMWNWLKDRHFFGTTFQPSSHRIQPASIYVLSNDWSTNSEISYTILRSIKWALAAFFSRPMQLHAQPKNIDWEFTFYKYTSLYADADSICYSCYQRNSYNYIDSFFVVVKCLMCCHLIKIHKHNWYWNLLALFPRNMRSQLLHEINSDGLK